MSETLQSKRELLAKSAALLASFGLAGCVGNATAAPALPKKGFPLDYPGTGAIPWIKRIFHLYTGPDGLTRAEQLPVTGPETGAQVAQLLRRTAERVTIGGTAAGAGYDFHVAHQPTLLITLFGSMIIELHDGTQYALEHGDLAIAEDCSGKGHISRAGPEGSFMVAVQLPQKLCPASGSSDMSKVWQD
ncbi:hypothetical protein [Sphingobium boeckii]|uniref:Cupin domain-containing protein n=1 Tax=Sphingobium boeckii TaxID=1082345 RepID=A0A7W9AIP5_9SPHN|nr:hypothetical protein [Sphingobium boeckii]MBB5686407.1 hypothetical protein [Sphingobium boeckii]